MTEQLNGNEELIEQKRGEIRGFKNLLEQGDYKARKLLFEVCSIIKEQFPLVEMPIFEHYENAEEEAQFFRDEINRLEEEIKELEE